MGDKMTTNRRRLPRLAVAILAALVLGLVMGGVAMAATFSYRGMLAGDTLYVVCNGSNILVGNPGQPNHKILHCVP